MVKILASILLFFTPLQAGVKKREKTESVNLSLNDTIKQGTDKLGNINLELIAKLKVGDLISFKLPTKEVVGKVTRIDFIEDELLKIIGIFEKEEDAGFGFYFSAKEGKVGGTLSFDNGSLQYKLRYNAEKQFFYLEKIEIPKLQKS
jgi:hypothetical protein